MRTIDAALYLRPLMPRTSKTSTKGRGAQTMAASSPRHCLTMTGCLICWPLGILIRAPFEAVAKGVERSKRSQRSKGSKRLRGSQEALLVA